MARSIGRALGIGLQANTEKFSRGLKNAENQLDKFKRGVKRMGAAAAAGFAVAGAAALMFGKSAIDAALDDQKAQKQLALTIKNNTKSRKDLNKAAEKSIEVMMNEYNIADDKLRPAFGKLVTATKSVSKTQHLMRTALDVSAGTGKSLDVVVKALSSAYLGNNTALGKLGVGIDKTKLKTMTFDQITATLSRTFSGQAKGAADSYAGSVEGLKIAWSEFNESVGYKILPKLKTLLNYIKDDLMPWLSDVKDGFTGAKQETISPQLRKVSKAMGLNPDQPKSAAYGLGEALKTMATAFTDLFKSFASPDAQGSSSTLETLAGSLTKIANAITAVTRAVGAAGKWWGDFTGSSGKSVFGPDRTFNKQTRRWEFKNKATGGPVQRGQAYLVGERGPEMFVPNGQSGRIVGNDRLGGGNVTINLNGIVDADSARRAIENVLRNSGKRIGAVDLVGNTI
jgi:hypothetical protein